MIAAFLRDPKSQLGSGLQDLQLGLDNQEFWKPYEAIKLGRMVEDLDLFWFEEPVEPDDYEGQAQITHATSIPIAAGENEYTRYGFKELINRRCVDILQPDALITGGITEFMKVAALAQASDLDLAPHGAQEVHIHLVAAVPNGLILEFYRDTTNALFGQVWKDTLRIKDGFVYAPVGPGMGLDPDLTALKKWRVA